MSFRYGPGLPYIHQRVNFEVPGAGVTAFVGPSGAGKSTVLSLIERFYETTGGRFLVDGRDIRQWPLSELRSAIGYVEQDAPVLAGTLRENLVFSAPGTTDDKIRAVLARTRLDTLAERLPHGLDTLVGHDGSKLSGGERQRVAIARALLRKPRLLLLRMPRGIQQLDLRWPQDVVSAQEQQPEVTGARDQHVSRSRRISNSAGAVQNSGSSGPLTRASHVSTWSDREESSVPTGWQRHAITEASWRP